MMYGNNIQGSMGRKLTSGWRNMDGAKDHSMIAIYEREHRFVLVSSWV